MRREAAQRKGTSGTPGADVQMTFRPAARGSQPKTSSPWSQSKVVQHFVCVACPKPVASHEVVNGDCRRLNDRSFTAAAANRPDPIIQAP